MPAALTAVLVANVLLMALLAVVLFLTDLATLPIFGHLNIALFVASDVAIRSGARFHPVVPGLPAFHTAGFTGG